MEMLRNGVKGFLAIQKGDCESVKGIEKGCNEVEDVFYHDVFYIIVILEICTGEEALSYQRLIRMAFMYWVFWVW